jgi:hypothetical protein
MASEVDTIYRTISGEEMMQIVRDMGFSPELKTDSGGDPMIVFRVEGMKCLVLFFLVTGGRARSLQFMGAFAIKGTLEKVNEWNRRKRYGKAHLDNAGDWAIQMDVDLDGGARREYIEEALKTWRSIFSAFMAFISS